MRISINLASRPFVELRPLFARLRLAMAALAVLASALGVTLHYMNARAQVDEAKMHDLKVQTSVVENERAANERRMMQPQNRAVLDRSKFLNDLFASKSFSWTAVMMDLERVLPAGVQVTAIEPVITTEHEVNIRLRVSGDRDRAVELVRNLERSQRFLSPRLSNETAQTAEPGKALPVSQGPAGVEFDIMSGYNPLPAAAKEPSEIDKAATEKDEAAAPVKKRSVISGPKAAAHMAPKGAASPPKMGKKPANGGAR